MSNFRIGDLIKFSYPAPHPNAEGTRAHDKFPQVLVLHPNYRNLLHGLNTNYLTDEEINTLRMIIDPMFEMQQRENLRKKNPSAYAELESIIMGTAAGAQGNRNAKMSSPLAFYRGIIRPFIFVRGWDPYRLYKPHLIKNARIIQPASHMMGEDSLAKWKKEREQMALAIQKKLAEANTPQEKKEIENMQKELEKNTSMSQRQSILKKFSDF